MSDKVILHCDLNNFFASVEMLQNPELRGKAIAVCGDPAKRHGIVLAKSEPAKKLGVKTGMPIWQAKQLCPGIIIVATNHANYTKYSRIVQDLYYRYTDLVEPFGGDEAWLDVTKSLSMLKMTGRQVADEIRRVIREEVGLTASVGVSWNKTFAKLGSDMKKPDATTVVDRNNYKDLIYPLAVTDMLYVGKRSANAMERMNICTIGDLANANPDILAGHFGINAHKMIEMARGDDPDPVNDFHHKREIKSVGNGTTLPHDLTTIAQIEQVVYLLSEEVGFRMRKKHVKGTTINLSVRGENLTWSGAQETIAEPTCSAQTIQAFAMQIFKKHWRLPNPVHSIRVAVSNLTHDTNRQMSFWGDDNEQHNDKVSAVFDQIRKKYGTESIMFGTGIAGEFKLEFEVYDS